MAYRPRGASMVTDVFDEPKEPEPEPQPMMAPAPPPPQPQQAPQQMAIMGLQQAMPAPPGPGWADDGAMMSTVQGLGERSMGTPMETLRRVFQKAGRVY